MILDALGHLRASLPAKAMPLTVLVGPHEESMRRWAQDRGVSEHVITTGFLQDAELPPYLHAADVGLLPFADKPLNRARFPIKLGDYLAAGLPVLTNDVGEMGRIVREEDVGEVTSSGPRAYAAGLSRMLEHPSRLEACRRRARCAAEKMSWNAVSGELEEFYLTLRAGGPMS
jgi:glycosyltransferase involved in cell wall biosynthesis